MWLLTVTSKPSPATEAAVLTSSERDLGLQIDRYLPMLWLLSEHRLLYIRARGGLMRALRIRGRRCRIFKNYLASLKADFKNTSDALKLVMVLSSHDRPDLASSLVRAQIKFYWRLILLHVRLLRYRWSLS
jgi:hypothetical protein